MMFEHLIPVLVGTLGAATPLLFAGLGELVAEKSGVINLGVEGMMLIGAIAGFACAVETGGGAGAGLLAGALIFSAQEVRATVFGIALWFGALFALRLMAKADPKLRHVYLRHRRYKPYYPARSTPFRDNTPSQGKQYK
jgi:type IV secretion system protein VirB3